MRRHVRPAALVALLVLAITGTARAVIPDAVQTPILGAETKVGSIVTQAAPAVAPTPKVVDGDVSDWTGDITRLAGTAIYSHGEYVYQDHIDDSWGADDGFDEQRVARLAPLMSAEPRTYRLDPFQQAAGDQFGVGRPIGAEIHYGDTTANDAQRNAADIEEARVAADAQNLSFLVRTTGMNASNEPAVLILLDTTPGGSYHVPRALGGITTGAEWALLFADASHAWAVHDGGPMTELPASDWSAAWNPAGYINSVEISIARASLDAPPSLVIGIATGIANPTTHMLAATAPAGAASDLLNVAFRDEPARIWMDENQAFALHDGSIDRFIRRVDLNKLADGATQTFQQRPGYLERIYVDDATPVNTETMTNSYFQGAFQHYGVYLPSSFSPGALEQATFWFHYRGGHANDAAAWEPGILRQFGDETGGIVVTPSARGTSSWYTGRGMVDFLDVWHDFFAHYSVNRDRVYIAGHSMGGWASYLLGLLFPDRWAASNPEDGLLVPGLWTGLRNPSDAQDGADIKAEFLKPLIPNARNVPYAILHGIEDELVPVSSAVASAAQFQQLGYRYRLYLFYTYEHYSAPIWDDWRDIVRYMNRFDRDATPARVTYTISPALDHAVSTVSVPAGVDLGYRFDSAYWVSDLRTRTPGIDPSNLGTIDATTFGRGNTDVLGIPEAGAAGQPEVYTMTGERWLANGEHAARNAFTATLKNLAFATLDLSSMGLSTGDPLSATVTSDGPATLHLAGHWDAVPAVSITGAAASSFTFDPDGLTLTLTPHPGQAISIAIG